MGTASKAPKCYLSSAKKDGGGPSVSLASPTAVNQRHMSKAFAARFGSRGCIWRKATRMYAAVESTNRLFVNASPNAIKRYVICKNDVTLKRVGSTWASGSSSLDCAKVITIGVSNNIARHCKHAAMTPA